MSKIALIGIPPEWKQRQWRWRCRGCGTEGWAHIHTQGDTPSHDRPDGRRCMLSQEAYRRNQPLPVA